MCSFGGSSACQSSVPVSGRNTPANASSRLDLPAPLGPRSSSRWPGNRAKPMPSNKRRPPRLRARFSTVSRGCGAGIAAMPIQPLARLASDILFDYKAPLSLERFQTMHVRSSADVPASGRPAASNAVLKGGSVTQSLNSFKSRTTLTVGDKTYTYYSLPLAEKNGLPGISKLPHSMKVVLENLLRFEDGVTVTKADIMAVAQWLGTRTSEHEISYRPARVLMQDFTGVPAVVDLAAMRDATRALGADPLKINPLVPVDLVIDHSVMVDSFGTPLSFAQNVELEYERNGERYEFLRWGQKAFDNFRVVPPGTGICHQVNLEYLAQTVWTRKDEETGEVVAYPDTLVGTDSHTTMVNGLAVLGWGVGGIEAEAAMRGQPITMLIPEVVGFKMTGRINEGITATDLVLTVTEMLRKKSEDNKIINNI